MTRLKKRVSILFCLLCAFCFTLLGISCGGGDGPISDKEEEKTSVLTLSETALVLEVGETVSLMATNTGETLVWSAENEMVATVLNGIVTGVSVGETKITLRSETGIAECTVKVYQKLSGAFSASLNGDLIRLYADGSYQLSVLGMLGETVVENTAYTVEWTTENESVATVVNGFISAHSVGTAKINALVSYKEEQVLVSCVVNVIPQIQMSLENEKRELTLMDEDTNIYVSCFQIVDDDSYIPISREDLTYQSLTPEILEVNEDGSYEIVGGGIGLIQVGYMDYCTQVYEFTVYNHLIETAEQFAEIAQDPTGYFLMMADVDFMGKSYPKVSEFSGVLEGNGYSVSNITLGASVSGNSMFGKLSGEIRNIAFKNVYKGSIWGGMVGPSALLASNFTGVLKNMYFQGKISGVTAVKTDWADYTTWQIKGGFLIQNSTDGIMENCIIDATLDKNTDIMLMCISSANAVTTKNVVVYSSNDSMTSRLGYYNAVEDDDFFLGSQQQALAKASTFDKNYWDINADSVELKDQCAFEDVRPRITVELYDQDTLIGSFAVIKGSVIDVEKLPRLFGMYLIADYNYDFSQAITTDTLRLNPSFYQAVSNTKEFLAITGNNKYFLTNDIDFSGVTYTRITEFSGVLDGNGYSVKNVALLGGSNPAVGTAMFGTMSGTIQRVYFENIVMQGYVDTDGEIMVGGYNAKCGLIAMTFSGKLQDVYLGGAMPGVAAVYYNKNGQDYRGWGLKAGVVCGVCDGGVLNNVIINVKCSAGTDIKAVAATGTVTYGVVMMITAGNNTNPFWHDNYAYIAGAYTVEGSIETGYEKSVYTRMQNNTPGVWQVEEGKLPTLIKGCTLGSVQ